jgi:DNA-binding response OmpR family regulator
MTAGMSIIIIIDKKAEIAENRALDMGADDCLAKPVQLKDLVPHIKAVCRRALQPVLVTHLRAGPIDMDIDRWIVTVDGEPIDLTKTEFRLLQVLLEARGRAVTRELILNKAWSYSAEHAPDTRTVDVHIGRLRRKLGDAGQHIITVRNVGFRFEIAPEWIAPQTSQ